MKNLLLITFLLFFSFSYAQEITMFDEAFSYRFYQDQERISIKEANQLMLSDSLSALHWKRARTKNTIVNGLLICQLAFIVAGSSGKISGEQYRVLGPIFFASSFTSLGLAFSRQKSRPFVKHTKGQLHWLGRLRSPIICYEFDCFLGLPSQESESGQGHPLFAIGPASS